MRKHTLTGQKEVVQLVYYLAFLIFFWGLPSITVLEQMTIDRAKSFDGLKSLNANNYKSLTFNRERIPYALKYLNVTYTKSLKT